MKSLIARIYAPSIAPERATFPGPRGMSWAAILGYMILLIVALGCGGGGGGGSTPTTATLTGRILNVETPGPVVGATVQAGSNMATTGADGSFSLTAPTGTTSITVDSHINGFLAFTFTIPAASGTQDEGDLYVGPETVTVTGTVRDAGTTAPIPGAAVSFAGRSGITNGSGTFALANVAYSSTTQATFWGIQGSVSATNYIANNFVAAPHAAIAGVVTVDDVTLAPLGGSTPPSSPFNIFGHINPSLNAPGTIVTLRDNNGLVVRVFTVGSDATYMFWVTPGTYTISYANGSLHAPDAVVTLNTTNDVITQDATLS